jgi:hypothetical protein
MVTRTVSLFGRATVFAIAITSTALWIVSTHGQTLPGPASTAKPEEGAPPAPSAESGGTPPAAQSPAAPRPSRKQCEQYVGVLAGGEKSALLKEAEVKGIAMQAVDLVTCGAVRADADEPCSVLPGDQAEECRATRAMFHELRARPTSRAFMFDEHEFERCKEENALMAPVCEALRKAFLSGDPNQCVLHVDFGPICRSLHDMNASKCDTEAPRFKKILESHCRAKITLDKSACDVPGSPEAEKLANECRRDIDARKAYGQGLEKIATSGSPREKELAKAALKAPDACKELTKAAMAACLAASAAAAPAGATPAGGTAETTVPKTPKPTTSSPPVTTPPPR